MGSSQCHYMDNGKDAKLASKIDKCDEEHEVWFDKEQRKFEKV